MCVCVCVCAALITEDLVRVLILDNFADIELVKHNAKIASLIAAEMSNMDQVSSGVTVQVVEDKWDSDENKCRLQRRPV